jgi:hypothetical protein
MHDCRTGNCPDDLIQVREVRRNSFGRAFDELGIATNETHWLVCSRQLPDQLRPDYATCS